MKKRMLIMIVLVGALLGALYGFNVWKGMMAARFMAAAGVPAVTVTALAAAESAWQPHADAVGTLRAVRGADLSTEQDGLVSTVSLRSGAAVVAGQVLLELNAGPERAQLAALQAQADLAAAVLERSRAQFAVEAISKAQLDADDADLRAKRALVAEQRALIDKKVVRAPFAGRLGISKVNPGQYLTAGTPVVTLQTIDPIYVDFFLPQQQLADLAPGQAVTLQTDAVGGQTFTGKITAISSKVDENTRNVPVEALIQNSRHALLPGMFARVAVDLGAARPFLTVPQTAITYNPYGATVFLAKPKAAAAGGGGKGAVGPGAGAGDHPALVAQQVLVTAGLTRGDQVQILSGLQAGDLVVTSGALKLKNGTPLVVDNRAPPKNDPNPQPQEQ